MFDSPIEKCEVCAEMVLLDQTKAECAGEHHCNADTVCPLKKYFTGVDYKALVEEKKKQAAAAEPSTPGR